MCKHKSKNGFTLAELLIVVAIIAVLVAISIPVFTAQLKKARLAVDHTAIRDAYAIVQIANNMEQVEIEGTTYTFDELSKSSISKVFCLSKDCSSLLILTPPNIPDDAYLLKATGIDSGGTCPDCELWGKNDGSTFWFMSSLHREGSPVYISFVAGKLALGYSYG